MVRITPTNEAWKDCPRADECCVNDCPLTLIKHISDNADPQSKCTFGKTGRKRIGEKWGLKNLGLKPAELASRKKWDDLPKEVKEERIAKLKGISPIVRLSDKGYAITRKKNDMLSLHIEKDKDSPQTAFKTDSESGVSQ